MNTDMKDKIKMSIALAILLTIIIIVFIIVLQYQLEGEKNMPYKLSKITVISTAEGVQNQENTEETAKWNLSINQNNDIYFFVDENEGYSKDKIINSFTIQNIQVTKAPTKGTIKAIMPSSVDGRLFINEDSYIVEDKLEYIGGKVSNPKTLEIGNKGGSAMLRISNSDIGKFISDTDEEIVHDGKLITKAEATLEEIKFKVSFDIIMKIDKINYKARVNLELPYGDICQDGKTSYEITDMKDIVFKRENNNILKQIS